MFRFSYLEFRALGRRKQRAQARINGNKVGQSPEEWMEAVTENRKKDSSKDTKVKEAHGPKESM